MIPKFFLSMIIPVLCGPQFLFAQQGPGREDVPRIERLDPLSDYLSRPEDQQLIHYPFQRCSGLFLGYHYYAGVTFDEDTRQHVQTSAENLRIAALFLEWGKAAEQRGVAIEELPPRFFQDLPTKSSRQIQGFAFYYADRMSANFSASGAAFSEDPLIMGDADLCERYAEQAQAFEALQGDPG